MGSMEPDERRAARDPGREVRAAVRHEHGGAARRRGGGPDQAEAPDVEPRHGDVGDHDDRGRDGPLGPAADGEERRRVRGPRDAVRHGRGRRERGARAGPRPGVRRRVQRLPPIPVRGARRGQRRGAARGGRAVPSPAVAACGGGGGAVVHGPERGERDGGEPAGFAARGPAGDERGRAERDVHGVRARARRRGGACVALAVRHRARRGADAADRAQHHRARERVQLRGGGAQGRQEAPRPDPARRLPRRGTEPVNSIEHRSIPARSYSSTVCLYAGREQSVSKFKRIRTCTCTRSKIKMQSPAGYAGILVRLVLFQMGQP